MNGLDKIIESIIEEGNRSAGTIIADANAQAENIINSANATANEIIEKAKQSDEKNARFAVTSANAGAKLIESQQRLSVKQKLIDSVIDKIYEIILSLPVDEYFNLIYKICKEYSHENESGEIILNNKDKARIPENFEKEMSLKGKLTLSEATGDFEGGFKLIYGGIEENCTFSAIIASKQEEVTDMVASMLFGG